MRVSASSAAHPRHHDRRRAIRLGRYRTPSPAPPEQPRPMVDAVSNVLLEVFQTPRLRGRGPGPRAVQCQPNQDCRRNNGSLSSALPLRKRIPLMVRLIRRRRLSGRRDTASTKRNQNGGLATGNASTRRTYPASTPYETTTRFVPGRPQTRALAAHGWHPRLNQRDDPTSPLFPAGDDADVKSCPIPAGLLGAINHVNYPRGKVCLRR